MAAFFIAQRLSKVVKTLLETASLLPETMQFLRNCPEKVEYSLPSTCGWWIVEFSMLGYGKSCETFHSLERGEMTTIACRHWL